MLRFSCKEDGNLHKIIALSNSEGHDVQEKSYKEEISKLCQIRNSMLYIDGFSETEARQYIQHHNPDLELDDVSVTVIVALTHYYYLHG